MVVVLDKLNIAHMKKLSQSSSQFIQMTSYILETATQFILSSEFLDPFVTICEFVFDILTCHSEIKSTRVVEMVSYIHTIFHVSIHLLLIFICKLHWMCTRFQTVSKRLKPFIRQGDTPQA